MLGFGHQHTAIGGTGKNGEVSDPVFLCTSRF